MCVSSQNISLFGLEFTRVDKKIVKLEGHSWNSERCWKLVSFIEKNYVISKMREMVALEKISSLAFGEFLAVLWPYWSALRNIWRLVTSGNPQKSWLFVSHNLRDLFSFSVRMLYHDHCLTLYTTGWPKKFGSFSSNIPDF